VFVKDSPVYQFLYSHFDAVWTHNHVLKGAGRRRLAIPRFHWSLYDLPARRQWLSGDHVSVVIPPNRFWRQGAICERGAIGCKIATVRS